MRFTNQDALRATCESANLRCLIQQQWRIIETADPHGPDLRAANVLLRRLLRRTEEIREGADRPAAPAA